MQETALQDRFTYHPPKDGQPDTYQAIRAKALELARLINQLAPYSAEQLRAVDRVDEAVMWANAAIARHGR